MTTADSNQNCRPTIAHLSLDAKSSQRAEERVAPTQHAQVGAYGNTQHAQVGAYGKILAGPRLHTEEGASRKVLFDQILCSR